MLNIIIGTGAASRTQIYDGGLIEERLTWQAGRSIWVPNSAVTKSDSLATLRIAVKQIEAKILELEHQLKETK